MYRSLSGRLVVGFTLATLVFAAALAFAIERMHSIRIDLRRIQQNYLVMARSAAQIRTIQEAKDAYINAALLENTNPNPENATDTANPQARITNENQQKYLAGYSLAFYPKAIADRLQILRDAADQSVADAEHPKVVRFAEEIRRSIDRCLQFEKSLNDIHQSILQNIHQIDHMNATNDDNLLEQQKKLQESLRQELLHIVTSIDQQISDAVGRAEQDEKESIFAVLALFVVAACVGIVTMIQMQRSLRPLSILADAARAVGQGQKPVLVTSDDTTEVGTLSREFSTMYELLAERERTLETHNQEMIRLKSLSDNVLRSIGIGVIVVDADGSIRHINPSARKIFQVGLRDLEGKSFDSVDVLALPLTEIRQKFDSIRRSNEILQKSSLQVADFIVDITLLSVRDKAGLSWGELLVLAEDVTAREHARTQLVESERLAAVGRVAAQITHEIRNPLSSIGLNIDLLGDDVHLLPKNKQEEFSSILSAVSDEVSRLSRITEGYLRLARLPSAGRRVGDVGDLLTELCAFNQKEAERRGAMLELQLSPDTPNVLIDADRIRQACFNLLRNALEAAGRGGTVRVSVRTSSQGGAQIDVEDSGPGILQEQQDRLFDPFFTTKPGGTGLGLHHARQVVADHQGTLSVHRSNLGGALFRVQLPLLGLVAASSPCYGAERA